jgi:hypothetical protein
MPIKCRKKKKANQKDNNCMTGVNTILGIKRLRAISACKREREREKHTLYQQVTSLSLIYFNLLHNWLSFCFIFTLFLKHIETGTYN